MSKLVQKVLGPPGYRVVKTGLSSEQLLQLRAECDRILQTRDAGTRDISQKSRMVREWTERGFGWLEFPSQKASLVRCLLFDKRPESNWNVGWHQDLNLKNHRGELLPREHLNSVLTLRLHLEDSP